MWPLAHHWLFDQTWIKMVFVLLHLFHADLQSSCKKKIKKKIQQQTTIWWIREAFSNTHMVLKEKNKYHFSTGSAVKAVIISYYANLLPLVSLDVQVVNDKWGDIFARNTFLLSYIASIQRGKCNALDCIKIQAILCSSSIFKAFFLLLF